VTVYVGVDLHPNNNYGGIAYDAHGVLLRKKLPNDLSTVLSVLEPFRKDVAGIAVESTFNRYWFVDGLMDNDYKVHLANHAAIRQYEGFKNIDDKRSALRLANLLRLDILLTGYIYPKEERPTRDLLRKRLQLVRHRTSRILGIKNIMSRSRGLRMRSDEVKKLSRTNQTVAIKATSNKLARASYYVLRDQVACDAMKLCWAGKRNRERGWLITLSG
jgi:transposase